MDATVEPAMPYKGNDRLLFGIIMGVRATSLCARRQSLRWASMY
ncbi:hypothetical protein WKW77_25250 [Variovorax ureilyticus]|uniref:Uncharacterized protein n=1 Tax=Variovorax ureilyticus TaxID=1836198 RepID=A0ABU8VL53_9BURK